MMISSAKYGDRLLVVPLPNGKWGVLVDVKGELHESVRTARKTIRTWKTLDTLMMDLYKAGCRQKLEINLADLEQQQLDL